jgi:hypothetical protein
MAPLLSAFGMDRSLRLLAHACTRSIQNGTASFTFRRVMYQAAFRCRSFSVSSVGEACDEASLPRGRLIPSLTRRHRCVVTGNIFAPNQVNRYTLTETTTTQKRTDRKSPHMISMPDHLTFLLESRLLPT